MSEDETRTRGVDFGPLADDLESESYPIDKESLLEEYGDRDLEFADEETTLRDVLGPMGETTFESADEVVQSVLTMVEDDAVGREGYSDRGDTTETDDGEDESL